MGEGTRDVIGSGPWYWLEYKSRQGQTPDMFHIIFSLTLKSKGTILNTLIMRSTHDPSSSEVNAFRHVSQSTSESPHTETWSPTESLA